MDEALDIFRGDGFTAASLDRLVANTPYIPQALGQLGIFTPKPIRTRGIEIMQDIRTYRLIPTTEIGAPDVEQFRNSGNIKYLRTYRIGKKDRVEAHELQDIISTYQQPNNIALRNATELVVERLSQLKTEAEMTFEFHRLGAIQGLLLDADGSVIYNYFTEFGITQSAVVSIDFASISQAAFMQYFIDTFARPIRRSLKDRWTANSGIAALVGDYFWGKLMTHQGFYNAVLVAQQGAGITGLSVLKNNAWNQIYFAGITWINYMGTDDGTTIAIPSRNAVFFPTGTPDVFRQYQGPGETLTTANQMGQPWYALIDPDPRDNKEFIDIRVRAYPCFACVYPQCLMRATVAAGQ